MRVADLSLEKAPAAHTSNVNFLKAVNQESDSSLFLITCSFASSTGFFRNSPDKDQRNGKGKDRKADMTIPVLTGLYDFGI